MRYLVTARLRRGRRDALRRAIDEGTLGAGSVAGGEYLHDMAHARELDDGRVKWVETCFCATPLAEERDYWEEFFDLVSVKDAHARSRCRDENGTEPWACCGCDCTERLEAWLGRQGTAFEP
jgi:DMSO/TMAO reductase YedYZ molybdopterin-dependent catalytic subunit